jgi:AcrR family transcriptional regulator
LRQIDLFRRVQVDLPQVCQPADADTLDATRSGERTVEQQDRRTPRDRSAGVKQAIRDSATALFAEQGFAATGVREIAEGAGVDPTLVIRHFGSKAALFLSTMTLPGSWSDAVEGPIEEIGERLAAFVFDQRRRVAASGTYAALIRASDSPDVRDELRAAVHRLLVAPLLERLEGDDREVRAQLAITQVTGLMSALWVTEDSRALVDNRDAVIRLYGASVQLLISS